MSTELEVSRQDTAIQPLSGDAYSPAALALMAGKEAEVKAICVMAMKYPRDLDQVRESLLKECRRPSFAATAMYSKPVGGGKVTGLSVRFAEAAIAAMHHIHVTTCTLAETDDWRKIEARVWDAQQMVSYADESTIQKTIERKSIPKGTDVIRQRVNRQGDILYVIRAEEDDLLNKVNAAKSKSIRNSGLRLVPGWLLDECKAEIARTQQTEDAKDPDAAKRQLFDAFAKVGVTVEMLKRYLGHDAVALQPEELTDLRALYTAIKDGETTMAAVFAERESPETKPNGKGVEGLKQRLAPQQGSLGADVDAGADNLKTCEGVIPEPSFAGGKFVVRVADTDFTTSDKSMKESVTRRVGKRAKIHFESRDGRNVIVAIENAE